MPSPTPMPATPYAMPSPGVKAPYGFDSDYEAAVFGELEVKAFIESAHL